MDGNSQQKSKKKNYNFTLKMHWIYFILKLNNLLSTYIEINFHGKYRKKYFEIYSFCYSSIFMITYLIKKI